MRVVKFNSQNKPEYVRQDYLLDDKSTGQQVIGYWILCTDGDLLIEDGDYIIENDFGLPQLVKATVYTGIIKQFIQEQIGKALVVELFEALQNQNLSNTEEADLMQRIQLIITCLLTGVLRGARVVCNNIVVGGSFTAARKTYLLGKIDDALLSI